METKKIRTRKKFSGPEKSEDFSRKTEIEQESKTPILASLTLAASLAVLSGCDFSTGYVRTYPHPYIRYREYGDYPYYQRNYQYRIYRPYPYYQPNQFCVPDRDSYNPYNPRPRHDHNRQRGRRR